MTTENESPITKDSIKTLIIDHTYDKESGGFWRLGASGLQDIANVLHEQFNDLYQRITNLHVKNIRLTEQLLEAKAEMQWISVNDHLPEDEHWHEVCGVGWGMPISAYYSRFFTKPHGWYDSNIEKPLEGVTHWRRRQKFINPNQ